MAYRTTKALLTPVLRTCWRIRVAGMEHVPATGPAIIASNHLSIVDSTFLAFVLPRRITFVAKSEYFTGRGMADRVTARFLRGIGQIPVDRGANRAAVASLDASLAVLRRGELFGIYPEGTRSPDGKLYRARTGVAWLALSAGVPVIPVAMSGTARVLAPGRKAPRPGRVGVTFGPPLDLSPYGHEAADARTRRAVADAVVQAIQSLSGQQYEPTYATTRPHVG